MSEKPNKTSDGGLARDATLRDLFAGLAMHALLQPDYMIGIVDYVTGDHTTPRRNDAEMCRIALEEFPAYACQFADAVIAEPEKRDA